MKDDQIGASEVRIGDSPPGNASNGLGAVRVQGTDLANIRQGQADDVDTVLDNEMRRVAKQIRTWRRIMVTSHRDPDGDALGSSLGLALALRAGGYDVKVVNADPPIDPSAQPTTVSSQRSGLAAIPGADLVVSWEQIDDRPFDGAVLVDCSTIDRLHSDPEVPRRVLDRSGSVVVIDHHLAPSQRYQGGLHSDSACEVMRIVDPGRASSSELVAQLIEAAGLPIDRDIATALLTGLAVDTKGFLRDSTDARALTCASHLRALGGDLSIAEDILQRHSIGFLVLAGDVLARAVIMGDGAGIVASIPGDALAAHRIGDGEMERLTALLSGTRESYAIVLLQEQTGEIRGSVRTRAPVDAVSIARKFGGGGHASRAGFRVPGAKLDDVVDQVSAVIRETISFVTGH